MACGNSMTSGKRMMQEPPSEPRQTLPRTCKHMLLAQLWVHVCLGLIEAFLFTLTGLCAVKRWLKGDD